MRKLKERIEANQKILDNHNLKSTIEPTTVIMTPSESSGAAVMLASRANLLVHLHTLLLAPLPATTLTDELAEAKRLWEEARAKADEARMAFERLEAHA